MRTAASVRRVGRVGLCIVVVIAALGALAPGAFASSSASAFFTHGKQADVGAITSVSSGTTLAATASFPLALSNFTGGQLTNAVIHPVAAFATASDAGQATLDPNATLLDDSLDQNNPAYSGPTEHLTVPFDSTRSSVAAPPGLSNQAFTYTVTPQVTPLGAVNAMIDLQIGMGGPVADAHDGANMQLVSAPQGALVTGQGTGTLQIHVEPVVAGVTYTVTVTADVQNDDASPEQFSPAFDVQEADMIGEPAATGVTSYDLAEDGVDAAYSVDQATDWTGIIEENSDVLYDEILVPSAPAPSYTLQATPADLTASAGATTATHVTLQAQNGWNGTASLFLNGDDGGTAGPTPAGIHEGAPGPFTLGVGGNVDFPIQVDANVPAGDYPLFIASNDGVTGFSVPITLHVTAAVPQAQATAYRFAYLNFSGDAFADQLYANGTRGWRGDVQNFSSTPVRGPRIQLDTVSSSWALTPTPTLPADTGILGDLGQGQQAELATVAAQGAGTSQVGPTPVTPGFSGSRSSTPSAPNAGDTETTTVSLTLDDAKYDHGFAEIDVYPHDPSSPDNGYAIQAGAIVAPSFVNGESMNVRSINSGGYAIQIVNPSVGVTYTFQVPITAAATGMYKPFVTFRGGVSTSLPTVTGGSTSITDTYDASSSPDGLGGTWSFSSSDSIVWNRSISAITSVNLRSVSPPPFAVTLDSSTFDVRHTFTITPNATVGSDAPGTVSFFITGDAFDHGVRVSGSVAPGATGQIQIRAGFNATPGTYSGLIGVVAQAKVTGYIPVTIDVLPYVTASGADDFTAAAGSTVDQHLTITPEPGFSGDVHFVPISMDGLTPVGWSPVHVDSATGPVDVDLPFTISPDLPPGDYTEIFQFDAGFKWAFTLHVTPGPGFSLNIDQQAFSGPSNSKFHPTVTVSGFNGFSGDVTVSLVNGTDNVPPSTAASGTVAAGSAGQITIRDSYPTPIGTYHLRLAASGAGAPTVYVPITLTVSPYFVPSGNDQFTANAGTTVDQPLTLVVDPGFTGDVSAELGTYSNGTFTPGFAGLTPVGWSAVHVDGANGSIDLPFAIDPTMTPGDYVPALRFNGPGNERIWVFDLTVEPPKDAFVHANGTSLAVDGQAFRPIGLDVYQANSNGWCGDLMDGTVLDDAATTIATGGNTIRAWFFQQLATTNGARDWTRFDHTLAVAKAHHLRVIATLVDEWGDCGQTSTSGPGYGKKTVDWYAGGYQTTDPLGTESYRDFAIDMAKRYRANPTIMAWQLVNEPEDPASDGTCPADASATLKSFASDVSGAIRANDPNHLISLGTIGSGQCGASSDEFADVMSVPTLDLCEFHDYNPVDLVPGDQWNGLARRIEQCGALNKPLVVGELGIKPNDVGGTLQARADTVAEKLCAQTHAGVAGVLLWNWRSAGSLLDSYEIGPGDPVFATLAPYTDASYTCAPPSEPRALVAAAGDGIASVSWSAPSSSGGAPVLDYTVTVQPGGATQTVSGTTATLNGLADGTAYTFTVTARNGAGEGPGATSSAVTPVAGASQPTTASGDAAPGGTVSTASSPTAAQPVAIGVTTPTGGTVSLATTDAPAAAPSSFDLLGQQVQITAPPASTASPLHLTFTLDASLFADGTDPASVQVFRDGTALPACTGAPGTASPDACVASRTVLASGDLELDVLSSHASLWGFGVAATPVTRTEASKGKVRATPGDSLAVGLAFDLPQAHAAGSADFARTSFSFAALCGTRRVTFAVPVRRLSFAYVADGTGWIPTAEQTAASSFQAIATVPDACGGDAWMTIQAVTLSTDVRTTHPVSKLGLRWHYSLRGTIAPWSTTANAI